MSGKKTPFFSIIIPTLNEENYISRLLKTINFQKYKSFEVIIVDNGSKDETIPIVRKFRNRHDLEIKVVKCSQRGISYARNHGVQFSKGKYLVFFDADARLDRNWLDIAHKSILDNKTQVVGGINIFVTKRGEKKLKYNLHAYVSYFFLFIIQTIIGRSLHITGNNMAIEKNLFIKAGMFPHVVGEDIYLNKTLLKIVKGRKKMLLSKNMILYDSTRRFENKGYLRGLYSQIRDILRKKSSKKYDVYR